MEKKLKILAEIAEEFNKQQLTWAVGASLLLYLKGIVGAFHDIDIMVAAEDAEKAKQILLKKGTMKASDSNKHYKTKYFFEFVIEDVEIDLMGDFVIVDQGVEYDCHLKKEAILGEALVNGQMIPLQSLKEWQEYYRLMGRVEKARLIEEYRKSKQDDRE